MAQFVGPIQDPLESDQGCPEVRNAVMATTTVELPSDSSNRTLTIARMFVVPFPYHVQEGEEELEQQFTPMYLVYAPRQPRWMRSTWRCRASQQLRDVSIPNNVRGLCNRCFYDCKSLRLVNFGSSSSLERIGDSCFEGSGVEEVSIPDSVRRLCDRCFYGCKSLRRVNFGSSSSLELIGDSCFADSGVEEMSIPDGVRQLCDDCFKWCGNLRRVNFGSASSLERISARCFAGSGLVDFAIPSTVGTIGGGAFGECRLPEGLICRDGCHFRALDGLVLSHDCELCFCSYGVLSSVRIPDAVRGLCNRCFYGCKSLRRVNFGSSSSLELIGVSCFAESGVEEVSIPDSVRRLCDRCFYGCKRLRRVKFGSSSSLERIGVECFADSGVEEVSIPDGVRELCDRCFKWCENLRRVNFGSSSSLERIGAHCFAESGLDTQHCLSDWLLSPIESADDEFASE